MQPFINPYLFQNPYFTQCGNNTSPSIQNICSGLNGKYVNDFNEITASDVPMGAQPSIFVRNDRSEIQLREWNPNGQIVSTQYIPFIPQKQEEAPVQQQLDVNAIINPIFEKISALEDKLDKLAKPVTVRKKDGE